MADQSATTVADELAGALAALTERAFSRCLFPAEVKRAMAALDAYGWPALATTQNADQVAPAGVSWSVGSLDSTDAPR